MRFDADRGSRTKLNRTGSDAHADTRREQVHTGPAFRIRSIAMNQQNASTGMTDGHDEREPWGGLLASAGPRDHIVQLYQDQEFLNRAVCRFAASAMANGEGVILVPTEAHWEAFRPRLEAEGVDIESAKDSGQLTVVDSDELLPQFMRDAMPDAPVFLGLAGDVIA